MDRDWAAEGPFRETIAHGYLTLSLASVVLIQLLEVIDAGSAINYGFGESSLLRDGRTAIGPHRRWRIGQRCSVRRWASDVHSHNTHPRLGDQAGVRRRCAHPVLSVDEDLVPTW